ncbi:NADH dehydrogenase subunit I [Marinovum algicola DG 898]|nr:NADH dehydrogenase subunit I [Marinovum algicola DG 898]
MTDLKNAILDAKYIDMVSLADFVVQDCGLPDYDDDGNPLPQQNEIAAAIFRWAAKQGSAAEAASEAPAGDTRRNWPNIGKLPEKDAGEGED